MPDTSIPHKDDQGLRIKQIDLGDGTFASGQAVVGPGGLAASVSAYNYLRVTDEPVALFSETFDTLDTVNRWTLKNATGTATAAAGVLTVTSSTTASAYGGCFTKPLFSNSGINFLAWGSAVQIPTFAQANAYRFFGLGTAPATPTTAVPVTDGVGFEIDGAGNLNAVIYESGVKSNTVAIPAAFKPANGAWGRYAIVMRADTIIFYVNSITVPAAVISFAALDVGSLPALFLSVAGATPPAASANILVMAFGIGDTGKNQQAVSDGTNPFIRATVKLASTESVGTDTALVVTDRPQVAPWVYAAAAGGIVNTTDVAMAAAAGAGLRNYLTSIQILNQSTTVNTEVVIKDGATVIWRGWLGLTGSGDHHEVYVSFPTPLRTTANTALNVACITTGAAVYVNAQGYVAA